MLPYQPDGNGLSYVLLVFFNFYLACLPSALILYQLDSPLKMYNQSKTLSVSNKNYQSFEEGFIVDSACSIKAQSLLLGLLAVFQQEQQAITSNQSTKIEKNSISTQ